MSRAPVIVVKLGGSLLESQDLKRRLRDWLATEQAVHDDSHFVIIVGGGKLVDTIRDLSARSPLDDASAHWICVDLMDTTAQIIAALLPELTAVDDFALLRERLSAPGVTLFQPSQFLRAVEPCRPGTKLARDWSVTSDSIAGRLAIVLGASELVLIKSIPPPTVTASPERLSLLAKVGFIDDFLPSLAAELPPTRFSELLARRPPNSVPDP